jgi:hypothetical protein
MIRYLLFLFVSLSLVTCGYEHDYTSPYGIKYSDETGLVSFYDVDVVVALATDEAGAKAFGDSVEVFFVEAGTLGAYGKYYYPSERMFVEVIGDCICETALAHEMIHHIRAVVMRDEHYYDHDPAYFGVNSIEDRLIRRCYRAMCPGDLVCQ